MRSRRSQEPAKLERGNFCLKGRGLVDYIYNPTLMKGGGGEPYTRVPI